MAQKVYKRKTRENTKEYQFVARMQDLSLKLVNNEVIVSSKDVINEVFEYSVMEDSEAPVEPAERTDDD